MYFQIPSKPTSPIASYNSEYSQLPPPCILGCLPVSRCATLFWKLPRARYTLGVSTHVSAQKRTPPVSLLKKMNYLSPYKGCLPLQASNHLPPSSPVQGTYTLSHFQGFSILRPCRGPSQILWQGMRGRTRGSWRPRGDLSTRESPRSEIPQSIRHSFRGWDTPLR